MIAVIVTAGETLSGIAQQNRTTWQVLAADNHLTDPNLIYVGQTINIPGSAQSAPEPPTAVSVASGPPSPSGTPSAPAPAVSDGTASFSIPGMPASLASCIAFRESTDGTNPAADGNVFGIIPASGYNVAGDSLAQQEQVAGQIYATTGASAWAADGCPGT